MHQIYRIVLDKTFGHIPKHTTGVKSEMNKELFMYLGLYVLYGVSTLSSVGCALHYSQPNKNNSSASKTSDYVCIIFTY